ncbi:hypothetical protein VTI74DRAFT_2716 [Chaetomium olivicolor]
MSDEAGIPSTPLRPGRSSDLSRDERLQIKTFYEAGWSYNRIVEYLRVTPPDE